ASKAALCSGCGEDVTSGGRRFLRAMRSRAALCSSSAAEMRSTFSLVRISALVRCSISARRSSLACRKASKAPMNSLKASASSLELEVDLISGAGLAICVMSVSLVEKNCGAPDGVRQARANILLRQEHARPRGSLDSLDACLGQHRKGDDGNLPEVDFED